MVQQVGLEPTKPEGGRFTVSSNCRYATAAYSGDLDGIRTRDNYLERVAT